jgi:UPF0716 protein FxsA
MTLPVLPLFLLILLGVPLGELYVLIHVGDAVGAFNTIFLVVLTAVVGMWLVRRQGLSVLLRVRETLDRGEAPALEMVEGVLLLIAGLTLLFPGFVTDMVGFLLLVPPLRLWLVRQVIGRWQVVDGGVHDGQADRSHIIEGTWRRDDDEPR